MLKHCFGNHLSGQSAAIHVISQAEGGNVGRHQRLFGSSHLTEHIHTLLHIGIIVLRDFILALGVFHFAKADGLVATVNEQVDLGTLFQVFVNVFRFKNSFGRTIGP